MFKSISLLVLISVATSLAQTDINVVYFKAPDTTWAVDAVSTLESSYDAFWPHRFLVAQSWINSFTLLHNGVYDVAYGHNLTVITNSTVFISLEVWEHHPEAPAQRPTILEKVILDTTENPTTQPPSPPPDDRHTFWNIILNAST